MGISNRIKKVRLSADISQRAFGKSIGISGPSITKIESGENNPSEQTVKLISTTYRVNYHWLKDGEGEMYIPAVSDDMLVDEVMAGENEFAKSTFRAFAKLGDAEWQLLKTLVDEITRRDG